MTAECDIKDAATRVMLVCARTLMCIYMGKAAGRWAAAAATEITAYLQTMAGVTSCLEHSLGRLG